MAFFVSRHFSKERPCLQDVPTWWKFNHSYITLFWCRNTLGSIGGCRVPWIQICSAIAGSSSHSGSLYNKRCRSIVVYNLLKQQQKRLEIDVWGGFLSNESRIINNSTISRSWEKHTNKRVYMYLVAVFVFTIQFWS